jgi:2-iminobutanoate/2-iminopropanoate deaminase
MKKCITHKETTGCANPSNPFSPAVIATGPLVFISGNGPLNPKTFKVERGTLEEQFDLTMENIKAHLQAAGTSLENIVSMKVYLSVNDADNWQRMNVVYRKWFTRDFPVRTTVGCQLLGIDVEIDCVAVLS